MNNYPLVDFLDGFPVWQLVLLIAFILASNILFIVYVGKKGR